MNGFKKILSILGIIFFANLMLISFVNAQTKKWENIIAGGKTFTSLAEEKDFIWAGSDIGLIKVNKDDGQIEIYDRTSGMPGNYITAISIDKNNTKWLGVSDGYLGHGWLVKYDNNNFIYDSFNSKLPSDYISALYADKKGNIWIGCSALVNSAYLVKYDGTNWVVYNSNNSTLPSRREITSITEDSTSLWVGTKGGLVKFDGTNWCIFKTSNSDIPAVIVNDVIVDKNNNKWVALANGIAMYNDTSWTVIADDSTTPFYHNQVYSISIDNNNDFWIGTYKGLVKFDHVNYTFYNSNNSELPANEVDIIMTDADNNKWLGCCNSQRDGRLVKFNEQNWRIFKTWKGDLSINYINFIRKDNSGKMWIGSTMDLFCADGDKWDKHTWNDTLGYQDYYGFNSCVSDNKNNVWVSIYSDIPTGSSGYITGLLKFDGENWSEFRPNNSGLPVCSINSLFYSKIDEALLLSTSEGIIKFDDNNWSVFDTLKYIIPGNNINAIAMDGNTKWVASDEGVVRLSDNNWQVYNTENSELLDNRVFDIVIDSNKNVWAATFDGLLKYDGINWTNYNTSNSGLLGNWIMDILVDKNNVLWVGTNRGLTSFDGTEWKTYTKENSPLLDNRIMSIEEDSKGNIWCSCYSSGISIFNQEGVVNIQENFHDDLLPLDFILSQNYPNPFNPTTSISYTLPEEGRVQIKIFDILGREVETLVDNVIAAGKHKAEWNGSKLASGIYFYSVTFKNQTLYKKMLMIK